MGVFRDDTIVDCEISILPAIMDRDARHMEGGYWPFYEPMEVADIGMYDTNNYPSEYVAVYIGENYRDVVLGWFEANVKTVKGFDFPFFIFTQYDFMNIFLPRIKKLFVAEFNAMYKKMTGNEWKYVEPTVGGFYHIDDLRSCGFWDRLVNIALDLHELAVRCPLEERLACISRVLAAMAYGDANKKDSVNRWLEIVLNATNVSVGYC